MESPQRDGLNAAAAAADGGERLFQQFSLTGISYPVAAYYIQSLVYIRGKGHILDLIWLLPLGGI